MNWAVLAPVIASIVTALGLWGGQKLIAKSKQQELETQKVVKQAESAVTEKRDAGTLALDVAERADARAQRAEEKADLASERVASAEQKADKAEARTNKLEEWQRKVIKWWLSHERRDIAIEQELERLDPGSLARLPPRVSFPAWDET